MDTRICDLNDSLDPIQEYLDQIFDELEVKGIKFRPHFWLSVEWFTIDGIPGVAIPFYITNPDLLYLECLKIGWAEGSGVWILNYLRHEVGHAICTAYSLQQRAAQIFGSFTKPYNDFYYPQEHSIDYVDNLGLGYAQSHPADDFAETFAVWLADENLRWSAGAAKKLRFMDKLMATRGPIINKSRAKPYGLKDYTITLRQHYELKLKQLYEAQNRGMVFR